MPEIIQTEEDKLIAAAKTNPQAFCQLYDRYVTRIYNYVLREMRDDALAQDIVSATFEKALRNLPRYQWRGTSFGAWLYKIARNEMLMHQRGSWRFLPLYDHLESPLSVEQLAHASAQWDVVSRALAQLSSRDQELLRLHYFEDLSHLEVAEILNTNPRNVAVRLHRALKRLKTMLERRELASHA